MSFFKFIRIYVTRVVVIVLGKWKKKKKKRKACCFKYHVAVVNTMLNYHDVGNHPKVSKKKQKLKYL